MKIDNIRFNDDVIKSKTIEQLTARYGKKIADKLKLVYEIPTSVSTTVGKFEESIELSNTNNFDGPAVEPSSSEQESDAE